MNNNYKRLLSSILLVSTSVFAQDSVTVAPAPPAITAAPVAIHAGVLKSVHGDVSLLNAKGAARPARAGEQIQPTDRIVTGTDAAASLVLRDGTVIVVGPTSQLDLKAFQFDAVTHKGNLLVSLLQGSMRMLTGLLGKAQPEAVRIDTRSTYVGIRGTDFIVQADPI
ncbi:FecR domain-containing protein [Polaromonas sp. UC242_47]|uniref:FecR family protein n=1 Tax=Polaromonas sp. UC242_47 TaxID=3374626 RepID=UPI0037B2CD0F